MKKRDYGQLCSLAKALDVVGERWTLLIIRDLLGGPKRYKDLITGLPGMGANLLASRLKAMEGEGLIEKTRLPPPSRVSAYQLSQRGQALENVVVALARWGIPLLERAKSDDLWSAGWNHLAMKARFNAEAAQEISGVYAFQIDKYAYFIRIEKGEMAFEQGQTEAADVRLICSESDFKKVFVLGEMSLEAALEQGIFSIEGDPLELKTCLALFR